MEPLPLLGHPVPCLTNPNSFPWYISWAIEDIDQRQPSPYGTRRTLSLAVRRNDRETLWLLLGALSLGTRQGDGISTMIGIMKSEQRLFNTALGDLSLEDMSC